jgi:hypothetical protein
MRGTARLSVAALARTIGLAWAPAASADAGFTLAAAGDIACTPGETGAPPDGEPGGPDNFDPTWGAFKSIIYPAPGNHEWYDGPNGAGYFDYFAGIGQNDGRAGVRAEGHYSVNLTPRWHLITLNSNCTSDSPLINAPVPCNRGSAQER